MKRFLEKLKQKKLLLSFVCLILTTILVTGELFAWFVYTRQSATNGISIGVIGQTNSGGQMTIGGGEAQTFSLNPGNYKTIDIELKNTTANSMAMKLQIDSIQVKYPFADGFNYYNLNSRYIDTGDYYLNEKEYDISSVLAKTDAEKLNFMESFVCPVTNAIAYKWYFENQTSFLTEATNFFTTSGNANSEALTSNQFQSLSNTIDYTFESSVNTPSLNTDGSINITAGTSVHVYLVLYFSPTYVCSANYFDGANNIILQRKNSNAFLSQQFKINLSSSIS